MSELIKKRSVNSANYRSDILIYRQKDRIKTYSWSIQKGPISWEICQCIPILIFSSLKDAMDLWKALVNYLYLTGRQSSYWDSFISQLDIFEIGTQWMKVTPYCSFLISVFIFWGWLWLWKINLYWSFYWRRIIWLRMMTNAQDVIQDWCTLFNSF